MSHLSMTPRRAQSKKPRERGKGSDPGSVPRKWLMPAFPGSSRCAGACRDKSPSQHVEGETSSQRSALPKFATTRWGFRGLLHSSPALLYPHVLAQVGWDVEVLA